MSLDDWHLLFVSVCLILVLTVCAPLVVALMPSREEPFLALAVLGEEGMAEHYYPDNDLKIGVGDEIHWTVYLYNHMGESQYVAIKVKLLNATMLLPNSTSNTPSPAPVIYEVRRVLLNNETWMFPFSWAVLNVEQDGAPLYIRSLSVNGKTIETNTGAMHELNYRLVLELWVYDEDIGDLRFGWVYYNEIRCAWNQIWFQLS